MVFGTVMASERAKAKPPPLMKTDAVDPSEPVMDSVPLSRYDSMKLRPT